MISNLNLIGFVLLIITSSVSAEEFTREKIEERIRYWITQSYPKILPAKMAKNFSSKYKDKNRGRKKVVFFDNPENVNCVIRERHRNNRLGKSYDRTITYGQKFLTINLACLTEDDWETFEQETHLKKTRFQQQLFAVTANLWMSKNSREYKRTKKDLYAVNWFYTPWTLGIEIEQDIDKVHKAFYWRAPLDYMTNPNQAFNNPDLFVFLRDTLFEGRTYFDYDFDPDERSQAVNITNKGRIVHLRKANEAFWSRYFLIKHAKKSIHIQYFSWFNDPFGRALVGLLLKKLQEGVKVKIMLDAIGSQIIGKQRDIFQELVANGAEFKVYNSFFHWSTFFKMFKHGPITGLAASNHDKLFLIDQKYFIIGGRNIGTRYFAMGSELEERAYDDLDIVIEYAYPAISVLKAFALEFYSPYANKIHQDWVNFKPKEELLLNSLAAMKERMHNRELSQWALEQEPELEKYPSLYGVHDFKLKFEGDFLPIEGLDNSSRFYKLQNLTDKVLELIGQSKEIIHIQNPYVVLTKRMKEALMDAGNRGVKIIFSTPTHISTDSLLTQAYLLKNWRKILTDIPNSEMYGYISHDKLHSKVFVFDRKYTVIGSYNLDNLSENINSEFSVLIDSSTFSKEVIEDIDFINKNISIKFDPIKNIGPKQVPEGKKAYRKAKRFYWVSRLVSKYL